MTFTDEFDILWFEFDEGAYEKIRYLSEEKLLALQGYIVWYLRNRPTITRKDINDFVQFECDDFLKVLNQVLIVVKEG